MNDNIVCKNLVVIRITLNENRTTDIKIFDSEQRDRLYTI